MASWTTPTTYATGDILSVNSWNAIANNETFLYQRPACKYFQTVSQTLTGSATTTINLSGSGSPYFTSGGSNLFTLSSSTRIVVPLTGNYLITGQVVASGGGAGSAATPILTGITQNGTRIQYTGGGGQTNAAFPQSTSTVLAQATTGAYFEMTCYNYYTNLGSLPGQDTTFLCVNFIGSV